VSPHGAGPPLTAISRAHPDLDVPVIVIAPAAAFEQAMRGSNLCQRPARRQIAAPVDNAATKLTHIQGLSAWMPAGRRTASRGYGDGALNHLPRAALAAEREKLGSSSITTGQPAGCTPFRQTPADSKR
jgi:hypothetical protein